MWKEFKAFVMRGNVLDMAIGIMLGSAFTKIVQSLVNDVLMPPIGLLLSRVDFADLYLLLKQGSPAGPYSSLVAAQEAGAVIISYGRFINTIISFLMMCVALFLIVGGQKRLQAKREKSAKQVPSQKVCPYCRSQVPIEATRCPYCTSYLEQAPA